MNAAAEDIRAREATSGDERLHNSIDTSVSVDGTWQRRGFSSVKWSCCCNIYGKWKDFGFRDIN